MISNFTADSSTASETQYSLMQFLSLDMTGKVLTHVKNLFLLSINPTMS